jgi:hypothetical protein
MIIRRNVRLVVGLRISDSLLAVPPVRQCESEVAHIPVDILLLLQPLDVEIRNGHRESVVESYSAQRQRYAETRHARHILSNSDAAGVQLVQQLVGNHQVHDTLLVDSRAKVLVVATGETCADTVVGVDHASDTVEAETIELVLLHPESQVAEQETEDLVMAVVEQPAVPQLVSPLGTLVEVLVVAAVEHVQSIEDVLGCVTVDNIEQNCDAHAVRSVDELLEIIGEAISTTRSEEAVDLVAETGVVCVLHDSHELDGVVTQMLDSGEDVLCELLVCGDLALRRGDTDVCLVDTCALGLRWALVLELVLMGRVPEARIVDGGDIEVLGHSGDPGGDALLACVVVGDY